MRSVRFLLLCLLVLSSLAGSVLAAPDELTRKSFANGITFYYKSLPQAQTVSVHLVFPVGMLHEPRRVRGISHLLEHLIYRGNQQYTPANFHAQIDDQGGYYNGYTSTNHTAYLMDIPPERLMTALPIYLDLLLHPNLTETNIKLEQKIVTVEKALRDLSSNIFWLYQNQLTEKQFDDSINQITRQDLLDYHQQHYQPNNLTVIITGNFTPEKVFKYLAAIPSGPSVKKTNPAAVLLPETSPTQIIMADYLMGEHYQILFGFDLKQLSGKNLLIAKALPFIMNYESRQFDHLTNRPLDYEIFLYNLADHNYLVFFYRDTREPYSAELSEWHRKNLVRYFKYLQTKNFQKFLDRLSRYFEYYFEALESDPAQAGEYYTSTLFDPTIITASDASQIRGLKSSDFKDFVQNILDGKAYQTIVIKAL